MLQPGVQRHGCAASVTDADDRQAPRAERRVSHACARCETNIPYVQDADPLNVATGATAVRGLRGNPLLRAANAFPEPGKGSSGKGSSGKGSYCRCAPNPGSRAARRTWCARRCSERFLATVKLKAGHSRPESVPVGIRGVGPRRTKMATPSLKSNNVCVMRYKPLILLPAAG